MVKAEEARRGLGGYGARRNGVRTTQGQFNTGFGCMSAAELAKAAAGALGVLALLAGTLAAMALLNGAV